MNELQQIVAGLRQLADLNEPAIVATVVHVQGSAYRRPGARMLVTPAGARVGCVSGGCLERDVRLRGAELAVGESLLVTYDSTADEETRWTLALGCNGRVDILIERLAPAAARHFAEFVATAESSDHPLTFATILRAPATCPLRVADRYTHRDLSTLHFDCAAALADQLEGLAQTRHATLGIDGGELEVLLETLDPPQRLVLFGGGWDAVPLLTAAKQLGWHVAIVDPRQAALTNEQFAAADQRLASGDALALTDRTAVVVMQHDYDVDRAALSRLADSNVGYLGMLGPRARTQRMLNDLRLVEPRSLHAPVGLDIGAETPHEIALSIIAEIVSWRRGHNGGRLRERPGSIHEVDANTCRLRHTSAEAI